MAKTMVTFDFNEVLQQLDLNQRQFAKLLDVSPSSIAKWKRDSHIPSEHLSAARAITPVIAATVRDWVTFDLRSLRNMLGWTIDNMARALSSSTARIVDWENRGEIPHDRLKKARELMRQAMEA